MNTEVRFAIEKDDCYVVGEDDKEYKLRILKKTRTERAPSPDTAAPR